MSEGHFGDRSGPLRPILPDPLVLPPGNVCLGVWSARVSGRTSSITSDFPGIQYTMLPVAPLSSSSLYRWGKIKNSYEGSFSIRQLGPDGKTLSTPAPIVGKIVATRVTIDTDTQESLP